jgi:hypothetical protein
MTAMRGVFARFGFKTRRPACTESTRPSPPDLGPMTGAQIDAAVRELERKVRRSAADLAEDLADGASARGEPWRQAASHARAKRQALLVATKAEATIQRAAEAAAPKPDAQAREAAWAAAREPRMGAWERRQMRLTMMFVLAARRALPDEDWTRVWTTARGLFPDAPEWRIDESSWER